MTNDHIISDESLQVLKQHLILNHVASDYTPCRYCYTHQGAASSVIEIIMYNIATACYKHGQMVPSYNG